VWDWRCEVLSRLSRAEAVRKLKAEEAAARRVASARRVSRRVQQRCIDQGSSWHPHRAFACNVCFQPSRGGQGNSLFMLLYCTVE
jgi:hypothetical protein